MGKLSARLSALDRVFQLELLRHEMPLYKELYTNRVVYKGNITFQENKIPFVIAFTEEEEQCVAQIVFHDLLKDIQEEKKIKWLYFINHWNDTQGASYYLCLSQKERLYMRSVFVIDEENVETIYRHFLLGTILVNKLLNEINVALCH